MELPVPTLRLLSLPFHLLNFFDFFFPLQVSVYALSCQVWKQSRGKGRGIQSGREGGLLIKQPVLGTRKAARKASGFHKGVYEGVQLIA